MNARVGLGFAIAGGARLGLGHVMRCAAIAREALSWGWSVEARIAGDASAHETWQGASGGTLARGWENELQKGQFEILILDSPIDKERWIERARNAAIPLVLIDDPNHVDRVSLSIQPNLHDRPIDLPNHLSGPRFSILSDAHRSYAGAPSRPKNRFLMTLGGADPHRATEKLIDRFTEQLERSQQSASFEQLDVVLGAAYRPTSASFEAECARLGWNVHRALSPHAMARLMSESRLAVTGFGTSQTELAWHATPYLSVAHHRSDCAVARRLELRGVGRCLGWGGRLDLDQATRVLAATLDDERWRRESAAIGFAAVAGGRGIERILTRLERRVIAARAEAQPATENVTGRRLARRGDLRDSVAPHPLRQDP